MPELPEVETLCRQLRELIAGKKILAIRILDSKLENMENLEGRTVHLLCRAGKGLHFRLDDGRVLMLHLRMTGRLLWQTDQPVPASHTRFIMQFDCGRLDLIDPRRFATLGVQNENPVPKAEFDPLGNFSPRLLWERGGKKTLPIKSFLMDQRYIAGIGNIYACEILHEISISPRRKTKDLSLAEWRKLVIAAREILSKAITCRGTTVSDWRDLFGQKGEYQNHLKVYAKEGEPCYHCGGIIQRVKLSGRGTYFCPACQL
ncbi:MAG: bifunctional DNA-formamidopyrimidine glycosylase/DNA-(apurinic or apyrimidinic site) lyase [Syntrophales bacterium]|nr:bifunctional DNA-formamidopyrimidine glycosylase/DNA-(apurinic or apyrimidinic site) lyase [Syntrophales bacterium]